MPRDIREYSIWRSAIGCTAAALRIVSGPTSDSPMCADVAGLDHLGDRADGLLDRHVRIEPGGAVDVDVVGAEALQRVGQEVAHGRRPGVDAAEGAAGSAQRAELDAELHGVAVEPRSARPISISLWPEP